MDTAPPTDNCIHDNCMGCGRVIVDESMVYVKMIRPNGQLIVRYRCDVCGPWRKEID